MRIKVEARMVKKVRGPFSYLVGHGVQRPRLVLLHVLIARRGHGAVAARQLRRLLLVLLGLLLGQDVQAAGLELLDELVLERPLGGDSRVLFGRGREGGRWREGY